MNNSKNHPTSADEICVICIGRRGPRNPYPICSHCHSTWQRQQTASLARMEGAIPPEEWILSRIDVENQLEKALADIQAIEDQAREDVARQLSEAGIPGEPFPEAIEARKKVLWPTMGGNQLFGRCKRLKLLNLAEIRADLEERISQRGQEPDATNEEDEVRETAEVAA